MQIIEKGIKNRILDVQVLSAADEDVQAAERDFDKYHEKLEQILGKDHPVLSKLEEVVNNLRFFETEAAYRVGLSDGVQLQQEINGLVR